jgi:hypothetical protein
MARKLEWQERQRLVEPEADLPEFTDTIAQSLEDTISNLRIIKPEQRRSVEYQNLERELIRGLTAEVKEIREALAATITTVGTKVGKGRHDRFEKALTEKVDKRLDTVRNLTIALVTVGLTAIGIIGVFKH